MVSAKKNEIFLKSIVIFGSRNRWQAIYDHAIGNIYYAIGNIYILPMYQVIYCQLSDFMLPTTYCGNQEIPLINALGILQGRGCPKREFPKVTGSPYGFSMIP